MKNLWIILVFASTANISGTMKLGSYSPENEKNMSVIAFVQNPKTMKIEGAGEVVFRGDYREGYPCNY